MKISLLGFCIITLVLVMCCFAVEAEVKAKKCKAPLRWNPKLKKCMKLKGIMKKKPTTTAGAKAAAAATTAAPALNVDPA
ncbi:hypothetical protein KR084_010568 [Drosophila pseudotakahashii]|nr:hypothetical protein KR084_010568 [Drosophila pseudotakahashii]